MRTLVALGLAAAMSLPGQGIIATVAGGSKVLPTGNLPPLTTPVAPTGIAVGANGDLYFCDQPSNTILKMTRQGGLAVFAGNGFQGFSGDGGPAVSASLSGPQGIAVDAAGNVYFADTGNHRIRRVDPNGNISTVAGGDRAGFAGDGGPAASALLAIPFGVAVAADGTLFILDTGNRRVRGVSPAGVISTIAGNGQAGTTGDGGPAVNAGLGFPQYMAIDTRGNLYVVDPSAHNVRKVDSAGVITRLAGTGTFGFSGDGGPATAATLAIPRGVAADAAGNVVIVDGVGTRIRRVSPAGLIASIAGTGTPIFGGDNGPALNASFNLAEGVAVDTTGLIFVADTANRRVRQITPAGGISTVAGNGTASALGDGAPATTAGLASPSGIAVDNAGNLYIADRNNNRIRRIRPDGNIETVAGNGVAGYSGDGGQATAAMLSSPEAVATDQAGNLYIADTNNDRVRRVAPSGVITTFAGTGSPGSGGDNGPATAAGLFRPAGLVVDGSNNLYISDFGNNRIRRVAPGGIISTVAGNGTSGASGDGGPATSASLAGPRGLAVDVAGNLYIADAVNGRVRVLSRSGAITTFAGGGPGGRSSGDGGPATQATFTGPLAVAVDPAGTVYVADSENSRVRRIGANGTITAFAGTGEGGFAGDGRPAVNAKLDVTAGLALDGSGNLYIADRANNRVRVVLATPPTFSAAPTALTFAAAAGGVPPPAQFISVAPDIRATGIAFAASSSEPWLRVSPQSSSMPDRLEVTVDPASLSAGSFTGLITLNAPFTARPSQQIAVTVNVTASLPPRLAIEQTSLTFGKVEGNAPQSQLVRVKNLGSGNLNFQAIASTESGGDWLRVSPATGTVVPSTPGSFSVTADPTGLAPGTYTGFVRVVGNPGGQEEKLSVILSVTAPQPIILLSQTGLTFNAVQGGFAEPPQNFGVLNIGQGVLDWRAAATVIDGGNWLSVAPASGTSEAASLSVPRVQVSINPAGLAFGTYYGQITVTSNSAQNSPQYVSVVLNVLPPDTNPGPVVRPTGLIFTGLAGGASPGSQAIGVANLTNTATSFTSVPNPYGLWLGYEPTNAQVPGGSVRQIVVQPDTRGLAAGIHQGAINFLFRDNQTRAVNVLLVLVPQPGKSARRNADGDCLPSQLSVLDTTLGSQFRISAGWPATLGVKVIDDCGRLMTSGAVTASFSNGDQSIPLTSLKDGNWVGTWVPSNSALQQTTVTVTAEMPEFDLRSVLPVTGSVGVNQNPPVVTPGGIVPTANPNARIPLAPGALISIYGNRLSGQTAQATTMPLGTQLADTRVQMGPFTLPLLFASDGQVNALVPYGVPTDTQLQVVVRRGRTYTSPATVTLARSQPAIFTVDQSGSGQGRIFDSQSRVVNGDAPAAAGETVVIQCSGLGRVSPAVADGESAPDSPRATVVTPVSVSIGGQAAEVTFAGLEPGFVGLYTVHAIIPRGIEASPSVPVTVSVGGIPSNSVTMAVR